MSAVLAADTAELLSELRRLCARLPVPQPTWHPYVPPIHAFQKDFQQALELAAAHPDALDLLATLVEDDAGLAFDPDTSPELTAAWERLAALPIPDGQHPYLDDILPTLEAHRLLLIALSQTNSA